MKDKEIERLKQVIFSLDWQKAQSAVDELIEIGGKEVIDFLTTLSGIDDLEIKGLASLAIGKIKLNAEIANLKQVVFSEDWSKALKAFDRLEEIGGEEVFQFFLSLLELSVSGMRNSAALKLRAIADSRAVEPLLLAITKKENLNYNGTLVYALQTLDCSRKLKELFEILFYQGYEAKMGAMGVLNEQIFEFDSEELLEIKAMWEDCKLHPEKCPSFHFEDTEEIIEDYVEGFMAYLNE